MMTPVLGPGGAVAVVAQITVTQRRVLGLEGRTKTQGMGVAILRLEVIGGYRNAFDVCSLSGPGKERIGILLLEEGPIKIRQCPFFLLPCDIQRCRQGRSAGHAGQAGTRQGVDAGGVVDSPAGIIVREKMIRQRMEVTRQSLPPGLGKPGQILVTIVVRMDAGQFCHYRLTVTVNHSVNAAAALAAMTKTVRRCG